MKIYKYNSLKNIPVILLIAFTIFSCNNNEKLNNSRNIILNDTITTLSGLKYIFLKEGKGRKIEIGSKVKAYTDLYINDADTIFWTTSTEKDSIFIDNWFKERKEVHNQLNIPCFDVDFVESLINR